MKLHRFILSAVAGTACAAAAASASAADYVIGSSAALSGYLATVDRAFTDGVRIGVEQINKEGGLLGKQVKLVIEDNRSEPQEAVAAYNKMMLSDHANAFISGCLSAGNLAAAPILVRRKIPSVLCSILPKGEDQVHWAFSTLPRPAFEVEPRIAYLKNGTQIRKIGILFDQSPYGSLLTDQAKGLAPKYGIGIVGVEQFTQADADLSVQIKKLTDAGAGAILKMGVGPSTFTAAKNMKALGLGVPLLVGIDDLNVYQQVAGVLGKDFYFAASPPQLYNVLPESDSAKKVIAKFLLPWRAKYGDRDPTWAGRGYDAALVLAAAVGNAKSFDGSKVRDAIEHISNFQGTSGAYHFDKSHFGLTENPLVLAHIVDGKIVVVK